MRYASPRRSTTGYTLVELIVVVVIVGILAAIAAPGWLAFMNSRRATAARDQVLQAIRQAQAQAIRGKQVEEVVLDTAAALPKITALGVTQSIGDGQLEPNQVALQAKNGTANITRIEFDEDGNLSLGNTNLDDTGIIITVTVPPTAGATRCVIVQTLLGATRTASDAECN